jgi:hypothetical protein
MFVCIVPVTVRARDCVMVMSVTVVQFRVVVVGGIGVASLEVGVLVVADVEVEVKEAGSHPTMAVPIVGGVQTETADADGADESQYRPPWAGTSDHGSAEASHRNSGLILPDRHRRAGSNPVSVPFSVSVPDGPV